MNNKIKVFGYVRVSTASQIDNTSIDVQKERIKAYCLSQGWELQAMFEDAGVSGKSTDRPAFNRMIENLHDCDLILIHKLDRISRSLKDILFLIEDVLTPIKVGIKSVTEPFDSSTATGKLLLQMLGCFGEFERKQITVRMMSGKAKNAEKGGSNGHPIPYGYRATPKGPEDFVIKEEEAEIVLRMFKLYARGKHGATKLKEVTGCPLSPQGIRKLLKNPFYVGLIKYKNTTRENKHNGIVTHR